MKFSGENILRTHQLFSLTIKFTIASSTDQLPFLDILISVKDVSLKTYIHTKPTDSHAYLPNSSYHPPPLPQTAHTAFERSPLTPSKILHSVQDRNARFPSLRRALFRHACLLLSVHINHRDPFVLRQNAVQNSKEILENLLWTFFWLHRSDCLEPASGRPESFKVN